MNGNLRNLTLSALLFTFVIGVGCSLRPAVYKPSGGPAPDEVAVQTPAKAAVFTLLLRRVNVSRSNGLTWVTYRNDEHYRNYKQRLDQALVEKLNFQLIEQKALLDSKAYLAGAFPVREKFFLNPELLPIVRVEEDQSRMLRLGRDLKTDYFVTALADHTINKSLFFAPRIKARVVLNLYNYHTGHVGTFDVAHSEKAKCPDDYDGPANRACATQLNQALDRAFARAFQDLETKLKSVQVRAPGDPLLKTNEKKSEARGELNQPVGKENRPRYRRR